MPIQRDPEAEAALQYLTYLTWALEAIERSRLPKAARHARLALEQLRHRVVRPQVDEEANEYGAEARRFRDGADEAEQLIELAKTASRGDALIKIAETYRRTAEQIGVGF